MSHARVSLCVPMCIRRMAGRAALAAAGSRGCGHGTGFPQGFPRGKKCTFLGREVGPALATLDPLSCASSFCEIKRRRLVFGCVTGTAQMKFTLETLITREPPAAGRRRVWRSPLCGSSCPSTTLPLVGGWLQVTQGPVVHAGCLARGFVCAYRLPRPSGMECSFPVSVSPSLW